MAILTISNVKKAFGDRELFEDISFFVNDRERVAFIGANGTGKTTLLRIICQEESADSGTISKEPGIKIGYLPQEVDLPQAASLHLAVVGITPDLLECATELANIEQAMANASSDDAHQLGSRYAEISHRFDTLGGFNYEAQAKAILLGLGFIESELEQPVSTLSGGQKTRAALARLLLLSPDLLLLDEPTNHLDIRACEWLQDYLQERYNGAALIVSHDRYFMDAVVSRVVELENGTISSYPGNYSAYARQKTAKIEEQKRLYKAQQKEIARIEAAIQTLFSHRKFSRRDSKIKQLDRLERIQRTSDSKKIKLSLSSNVRSGREVVRLHKLSKAFPGKELFSEVDYVAERGRKIGVVGPNGSGKTTMLRILAGKEMADSGDVSLGHNVKFVYFAQEFDHLSPDHSVLEELLADADITAKEARDMLAGFLFMGDDAFKKVEVLSGGEQCRLALAKVLADKPNLLLLDEPTNHLDIASREALEGALRSFQGTVLVASHDRYLLDAIADEVIEIKDGHLKKYLGNYSRYRERIRAKEAPIVTVPARAAENPASDAVEKPRPISSLREKERLIKDLTRSQKVLEQEIENIESRMTEITGALGDEENYRNGSVRDLTQEYDKLSDQLHSKYAEWEKICDSVSEAESIEV